VGAKSTTTKVKGAPTSAGSRSHKFGHFFDVGKERKLRHVLRDHGVDAATRWADAHGAQLAWIRLKRELGI
jgi:hypothetical protein